MYNEKDRLESNSNYDECIGRILDIVKESRQRSYERDQLRRKYGSYSSYIFNHNVPSHTDNSETGGRKDYTAREIAEVLLGSITY